MLGVSRFEGIHYILLSTWSALDEVYHIWCIACHLTMGIVCSSRDSAAGLSQVNQLVVQWASAVGIESFTQCLCWQYIGIFEVSCLYYVYTVHSSSVVILCVWYLCLICCQCFGL